MKSYKCKVNLKNLEYYLNERPNEIVFENYDKHELVLLCYAITYYYRKLNFKKKYLDNFR
jgi:hypothetical protein